MSQSSFERARAVVTKYNHDMRDANGSARKPRIAEIHAVSRLKQAQNAVTSLSMNDIIEAAGAEGLLNDPLLKNRLKQIGNVLNSDFLRF